MALYRKKPVVIEAVQLTRAITVHTLEGDMKANVGDWLITGVNGEQYPCRDEIFKKTYEPVDNDKGIIIWGSDAPRTRKSVEYYINS